MVDTNDTIMGESTMSSADSYVPSWLPVEGPKRFVEAYGLGLLFSANVFGAGSVYILANTGANWGSSCCGRYRSRSSSIWRCTRCPAGSRPSTNPS